jgi:hypothetical protein
MVGILTLVSGVSFAGVLAYNEIKFILWKRKIKKEIDEYIDALKRIAQISEIIAAEITQAEETGKAPYLSPRLIQEFNELRKKILSSRLGQYFDDALKEEASGKEPANE